MIIECSLMVMGLLSYVHAKRRYEELCETMNNVLAHFSLLIV